MSQEVFQIDKEILIQQKGTWLKAAGNNLSILVETGCISGAHSFPRYLLETKRTEEIVQYADQSEELASLLAPAEG